MRTSPAEEEESIRQALEEVYYEGQKKKTQIDREVGWDPGIAENPQSRESQRAAN